MVTLTIRNLDTKVKQAMRVRAVRNARSVEAEARDPRRDGRATPA
ncbi:FitA-like ribbon-helix-helix domain-containing protein [Methylobacterium frigidaeris]|uniref:Antitoxin FitA-like ribbon-helix-helix domain-containing protein n=1 Tax=Methylobacterium frigidaeris TaxID=2038277 RepID=A0AA37M3D5_9HYPH|nr:hypothetical protein [Methylobacterium frigidaeris]GJD61015.1 hypothetical protein MPEAHAMD_1155 [Methylobacterium frigidaeris]